MWAGIGVSYTLDTDLSKCLKQVSLFSFSKTSLQVSVQSKATFFGKNSLKGSVIVFKCAII